MSAHASRLTVKAQSTLPRDVRTALGVGPGDTIVYVIEQDGKVTVANGAEYEAWLKAKAEWGPSWESFAEDWLSPEDCAAYDGLLDGR